MNIIKEVKSAWVARECKRLMPVSHKAEPKAPSPAQRLLAAQQAARRAA